MLSEQQYKQVERFGHQHLAGLVTLLFTDIVDSTMLKQRLGDRQSLKFFEKHNRIIRDCMSRFHNAQEINTAGDSFFLIFAVPSDAVEFSLLVQSRLRELMQGAHLPVQDRIGINVGEVFIREAEGGGKRDLFGIQVDTCARVMALAKGGQILMTRSVFDSARQVLKGEHIEGVGPLSWVSHGHYSLKGIDEPVETFEVAEMGHGLLTPPPNSEKARRYETVESEPVLGWRPAVGQMVPNTQWVLEKLLGHGGFGEVWLGRHQENKDQRVFKFCFRGDRVRSLKREATLFRLLKERVGGHPNMVGVQDVFFDEPPYYIMMDYVAGKNLALWAMEKGGPGRIPLETKLEIVAQVADGLQAAHDAGIIHRDVKPTNILVEEPAGEKKPHARLTDFGIGQVESETILAGITSAGFTQTVLGGEGSSQTGTQMYMAPEIIAGMPATARSDIYSLGVVLFQLLVGDLNRPLSGDWTKMVEDNLLRGDLHHCFAWDPADRFAGPAELARRLRELPARRAAVVRQQEDLKAKERAAYRRGALKTAGVAVVLTAVFAVLALYAFRQAGKAEQAQIETQRTLSHSDYLQAVNVIEKGDVANGLAYLARSIKNNPSNSLASSRLYQEMLDYPMLLPVTRFGPHDSYVSAAKYSPGYRKIATADDQTVRIWDAKTGGLLTSIRQETPVNSVEFSKDGRKLLAVSREKVNLLDAETGNPIWPALVHRGEVTSAQFNEDCSLILSIAGDNIIHLWNASSGQSHLNVGGHTSQVMAATFQKGGKWAASGDTAGNVLIWETETGAKRGAPIKHQSRITDIKFSPDGRFIATGSYDTSARIWDATNGAPRTVPLRHDSYVNALHFSPDSQILVTVSADQMLRRWDAISGNALGPPISVPEVKTVRFSPDGQLLASASFNRTVQLWDVRSGRSLAAPLMHDAPVQTLEFGKDWQEFLVACGHRAFVWKPQSAKAEYPPLFQGSVSVENIRITKDGDRIVACLFGDGKVWAATLDSRTQMPVGQSKQIPDISPSNMLSQGLFSADGSTMMLTRVESTFDGVIGRPDGNREWLIIILDMDSGKILCQHEFQENIAARLSLDGRRFLALHDSDSKHGIMVFDSRSGKLVSDLQRVPKQLTAIEFNPDGRLVATSSEENAFRVWDATSGKVLAGPVFFGDQISSISFNPRGDALLVQAPVTAQIFAAETGQVKSKRMAHSGMIFSAAFSPDGKRIVTTAQDRMLRVWDADSGDLVGDPIFHKKGLINALYVANGTYIAVDTGDSVCLYDVRTGKQITDFIQYTRLRPKSGDSPDYHDYSSRYGVTFCPDGSYFIVPEAKIHAIPLFGAGGVPSWLSSLAECAGGVRLTEQNLLVPVSIEERQKLKKKLLALEGAEPWNEWGRWVASEPHQRMIAPKARTTVDEYLADIAKQPETRRKQFLMERAQETYPLHPSVLIKTKHPVEMSWLEKWENPRVRLLTDTGFKSTWSPDGGRVVFGTPLGKGLILFDLATGQRTNLVTNGKDATWSPVGEEIAYVAEVSHNLYSREEIWLTDSRGRPPRKLMNGTFPSWLGDGKTVVAFSHEKEGLIAIDAHAANAEPYTFYEKSPGNYCAISPDGNLIAGVAPGKPRSHNLVIVERLTRKTVAEVPIPSRGVLPSFSGDGRFVAYGGFDSDEMGVSVYDLRTGKINVVAKGLYSLPAWSKDGTKLSFDYRPSDSDRQIWVISTDGLKSGQW